MSGKISVIIIGMLLFLSVSIGSAAIPPCVSNSNTYYGPMEPGEETTLEYPVGTYDLWFAELPMKFSTSDAANYKNWKWEKIENVKIKNGQELEVFLGLVGDEVESYSDWISGYGKSSADSGYGTVWFTSGSGRNERWAVILC